MLTGAVTGIAIFVSQPSPRGDWPVRRLYATVTESIASATLVTLNRRFPRRASPGTQGHPFQSIGEPWIVAQPLGLFGEDGLERVVHLHALFHPEARFEFDRELG